MDLMDEIEISGIRLAYRMRRGSSAVMILIHGLGDSQRSFAPLFDMKSLEELTLVTLDLPGCGDSARAPDFSYSMEDQAALLLQWLRKLDAGRVVLAGHSMGGVVALYVAEKLSHEEIAGLVNIEGNLGFEDCFFSNRIASYSPDAFEADGFETLVQALVSETASDPEPVMRTYAGNFSRTLPRALYRSSVSLVEESLHGNLKDRFRDLPVIKGYISGERSLIPSTAKYLVENNITHFIVPESGHFMMVHRPDAFCRVLLEMLCEMGIVVRDPNPSSA